jgi:hypothetical protein
VKEASELSENNKVLVDDLENSKNESEQKINYYKKEIEQMKKQ